MRNILKGKNDNRFDAARKLMNEKNQKNLY